jgi:Ca2+-binding RTX toxin-like protein
VIKVKATQAKQVDTGPSRSSFETGVEKFSSLPAAFGVFLVGLAVYLKGIVSTPAKAPAEEGPKIVPADQQVASNGGDGAFIRAVIQQADDEYLVDDKEGGRDGDVIHLTSHSGFRARLAESFVPDQSPPIEIPAMGDGVTQPVSRATFQGDTIALNDNARLFQAASGGGGAGVIGSSGGGGGGSGKGPEEPEQVRKDDGGKDTSEGSGKRNRAPLITGPVSLRDVSTNQSIFIPMAALLAGAVDPDGDVLRILNISASAGELVAVDGGFQYTPPIDMLGAVSLTFQLTDGEFTVQQVGRFQLVEAAPIIGTPGDDMLVGTPGIDMMDGREGDDTIAGLGSGDVILGGEGDDVIDAGAGNDTVFAGAGNDSVAAGAGDDIVWGGDGDDTVLGQAGADMLMGEAGNDSLSGGDGNDQVFGGEGNDTVLGDAGRDLVDGGEGDDVVRGGAGGDMLIGGDGVDMVHGDAGDDYIVADLDKAADTYDGGSDRDTVDYAAAEKTLLIDLVEGTVSGEETGNDRIIDVEIVIAGSGDDVIRFGTDLVSVAGGEGDDCFDFSALVESFSTVTDAPAMPASQAAADDSAGDDVSVGDTSSATVGSDAPADAGEAASELSIESVLAAISEAPAPVQTAPLTVQEILDFAVGDRIRIGDYNIRMRSDDDEGYVRVRAEDGSELRLEVQQLDNGLDDSSPFRVRIEERDGDSRTIVEVYIDSLDDPDFAIALQGIQTLSYYQNG